MPNTHGKPMQQGRIDGLYELDSVISGFNKIVNLNDEHREALFEIAIDYLDDENILKKTILKGLCKAHLKNIISKFQTYIKDNFNTEIVFDDRIKEAENITCVWTRLTEHLKNNKCVTIIGLEGLHNDITYTAETAMPELSDKLLALDLCAACEGTEQSFEPMVFTGRIHEAWRVVCACGSTPARWSPTKVAAARMWNRIMAKRAPNRRK